MHRNVEVLKKIHGKVFPVSNANRRRRSNFCNALSADWSWDPSGPVGPNEEGSSDSQPKRPHGAPKPPGEQVELYDVKFSKFAHFINKEVILHD